MKNRDSTLDLVRGVSALLVMLGHLRAFLFLDFVDLHGVGAITKLFYFSTGLGHQAVMVFFVLSGYFVGGSVLSGLLKGRFTWRGYAASRLTRLWMVLIPALLLTLGLDLLGRHWNPGAYAGDLGRAFMSGPTFDHPASWSPATFFGNVFFLQTVSVPVFGSNGPLWSLANEFWYYLLFPLAGCGFRAILSGRRGFGLLLLISAGLIAWRLPTGLVAGGMIWLLGVGVWWVHSKTPGPDSRPALLAVRSFFFGRLWMLLGGGVFLATLAASRTSHWFGNDYSVGIAFALWLVSLSGGWKMIPWADRLSFGLSEISYTLYVVHFPILFFAAIVLLKGKQFSPGPAGYLLFVALAAAVIAISTGMWWIFERKTPAVRAWVVTRLP